LSTASFQLAAHEPEEHDSSHEPPRMSPPGDAGERLGAAEKPERSVGKLDEKPGAKEKEGRNFEHRADEKER
jgi:hypothetical protein